MTTRAHKIVRVVKGDQADSTAQNWSISELVARTKAATANGVEAVWQEARICFELLVGHPVELLVNAAGSWFRPEDLDTPGTLARLREDADVDSASTLPVQPDFIIYIRRGSVAVRLTEPVTETALLADADLLAHAIDMALMTCASRDRLKRSAGELDVMRTVAARILETQNLDELLLLVSHETKRLLDSDICGVMMREGNEVVMRSCVGQFSADTAKLRMEAGVGVAGNVLQTGKPCTVENYVESPSITRDFVPLARTEKVRSALAVPIVSREEVTGVLEVWRRRPSTFSEDDEALLMSLAGLTSIAVENANLMESRARTAQELSVANRELNERYAAISRAAAFQEEIARLLLEEDPLPEITEHAAGFSNGSILILDRNLTPMAKRIEATGEEVSEIIQKLRPALRGAPLLSDEPLAGHMGDYEFLAQAITAGAEGLGWIVWLGNDKPAHVVRLSLGHVALAIALYLIERRRIARDRNETLEAVLWDLLDSNDGIRAAAVDRARELHVSIRGGMTVVVVALGELAARKSDGKPDSQLHDEVLDEIRYSELGRASHLIGLRGGEARLICKASDRNSFLENVARLLVDVRKKYPFPNAKAGVSGTCSDVHALSSALREAWVALEVARHRRAAPYAHYDDTGVLGLLINLRDKADMQEMSDRILGNLSSEPDQSRQTLLSTLGAYFANNCSMIETAEVLRVHQKTISYRIAKICRLTGLDLSRHQDRVLADVAVKLTGLLNS